MAPKVKPTSSKKGFKKGAPKASVAKTRKKRRSETFSIYVYRVLKQVHPETGISSMGMTVLNSFVTDIFERLATEAAKLADYRKSKTLTSREIESAVRLILPGELAKHATSEGNKALTKYRY